ncbi:MAG: hypothetical protein AAGF11_01495 [Myxococcota bacterium]
MLGGLLCLPACADDELGDDPMADGGTTTSDDTASDDDSPASSPTEGEDEGEDTTGEDPTGEDPTTGGEDEDAIFDCEDPNILIIPMTGPGFDPETGEFVGAPQDTYIAHTTLAVVTPEQMEEFLEVNELAAAQAMQTPGMLGVGFAVESECGFLRTIGLWEDEKSLYSFVGSGAHLEAMQRAPELSVAGKTTHWEIDSGVMPLTWDMAFEQLESVEPSPIYD